jgi:hypothetical protein
LRIIATVSAGKDQRPGLQEALNLLQDKADVLSSFRTKYQKREHSPRYALFRTGRISSLVTFAPSVRAAMEHVAFEKDGIFDPLHGVSGLEPCPWA